MSAPRPRATRNGGGGGGNELRAHVVERAALLALSDENSAANLQMLEAIESADSSFLTRVHAAAIKCATLRQLASGRLHVQQAPLDETHATANRRAGSYLVLVLARVAAAEALARTALADGGAALETLLDDCLDAITQAIAPSGSQREAPPLEQQQRRQPVLQLHQLCTRLAAWDGSSPAQVAAKLDAMLRHIVETQADNPLSPAEQITWQSLERSGNGTEGQRDRTRPIRVQFVPRNLNSWATLLYELCALQHIGDKQTLDALREAERSSATPSDLRTFDVKVFDVQELAVHGDGAGPTSHFVGSHSLASDTATATAYAGAGAAFRDPQEMQRRVVSLVLADLQAVDAFALAAGGSGCCFGAGASHLLCANALGAIMYSARTLRVLLLGFLFSLEDEEE